MLVNSLYNMRPVVPFELRALLTTIRSSDAYSDKQKRALHADARRIRVQNEDYDYFVLENNEWTVKVPEDADIDERQLNIREISRRIEGALVSSRIKVLVQAQLNASHQFPFRVDWTQIQLQVAAQDQEMLIRRIRQRNDLEPVCEFLVSDVTTNTFRYLQTKYNEDGYPEYLVNMGDLMRDYPLVRTLQQEVTLGFLRSRTVFCNSGLRTAYEEDVQSGLYEIVQPVISTSVRTNCLTGAFRLRPKLAFQRLQAVCHHCHSEWDLDDKRPSRLEPCGHILCLQCLQLLVPTSRTCGTCCVVNCGKTVKSLIYLSDVEDIMFSFSMERVLAGRLAHQTRVTNGGEEWRVPKPAGCKKRSRKGTALTDAKYQCPITLGDMENPVVLSCGHTFEKEAIQTWLQNHMECPLRCKLANRRMVTNYNN